jgi:cyclopropane-fatty-acyl-phospholipid synthase
VPAHGSVLSREQHAHHVQRLIEQKGLQGWISIRPMDSRDLPATERFHRMAPIGMCEQVGADRLKGCCARLHQWLLATQPGHTASGVHGNPLGAGLVEFIEQHSMVP